MEKFQSFQGKIRLREKKFLNICAETILQGELVEIVTLDSLTSPCDELREKFE
jgi:hypothetical protein